MKTEKRKLGDFGEEVAAKFLTKHGFEILERNYLKKWGEIDLVTKRKDPSGEVLHFVEVKTVVRGGESLDVHEPEENVHPWKRERLSRTIQTYLLEKHIPDENEFQCDVVTVILNPEHTKVRVKYIPDIEL